MKLSNLVIKPLPKGKTIELTKAIGARDCGTVIFVGTDNTLYHNRRVDYLMTPAYISKALLNALATHGFVDRKEVRDYFSESISLSASRDDSGHKNNIQSMGSTITYLRAKAQAQGGEVNYIANQRAIPMRQGEADAMRHARAERQARELFTNDKWMVEAIGAILGLDAAQALHRRLLEMARQEACKSAGITG